MRSNVIVLVRTFVVSLAVFLSAKVAFLLCHGGDHGIGLVDVADVLRHGLSLDLSTSLYIMCVPFLLSLISTAVRVPSWIYRVCFAVIAVALSLAFTADTVLYGYWGIKLDASFLGYLEQPSGITQSVSAVQTVASFAAFAVVALLIWLAYVWRCYFGGSGRTSRKVRIGAAVAHIALIPLIVIGIRGGLHESTTNVGQVYYSPDLFRNHAAVNPVFSFLSSLGHQQRGLEAYSWYTANEAAALTHDVFTTESLTTDTLLTTDRPNLLIILLESAGEQFAPMMPRLQQLKQQSVVFSRCYANSWRTDRGTVATLSGYPTFPKHSVMKMPAKFQRLPGIARTLTAGHGYRSAYLYGGDINFTNMRGYLIATGWQQLTSMDDFTASEQSSAKWGVRDDITFSRLLAILRDHEAAGHSYVVGYSSLSSHEPWDVPLTDDLRAASDDEVERSFAYLDRCLSDFLDSLRATPAWDRLLVVITADHGINHGDVDQGRPEVKNHVPMLWTGGAVRRPCEVSVLCSQTDLAATLFGQMHIAHDDFRFSRDVLSATYRYPTAFHNYPHAQMMIDSAGCIVYDFDADRLTVDHAPDGSSLQGGVGAAASDRRVRINKAVLQVTAADFTD